MRQPIWRSKVAAEPVWTEEGKVPILSEHGNEFRSRRTHRKSRNGCAVCKKRRIKCSETKPSCERCVKLDMGCVYQAMNERSSTNSAAEVDSLRITHQLSSVEHSMAVDLAQMQLQALFEGATLWTSSSTPMEDYRLLQHFQTVTSLTIGSAVASHTLHAAAGRLAWSQPYMMHMLLAVSAAHMKRLVALENGPNGESCYNLLETKHSDIGLQLYRARLAAPVNRSEYDSIIATTFLSTIFSYAMDDNVHVAAFSGTMPEAFAAALRPLGATSGFRALQYAMREFDASSQWAAVHTTADDEISSYSTETPGIVGLPGAFVDLFELDASSNPENNCYRKPLRLLSPLFRLPPSPENFVKLMAYMGRTWQHFHPLLAKKDPKALLLLSYWSALLRQIHQWWLQKRAETECRAIVAHLSQIPDTRIQELLHFPASFGKTDLNCIW